MKPKKPFTVDTDHLKVKRRILELESELPTVRLYNTPYHEYIKRRKKIQLELNDLYRLRHKQKNYTKPPRKIKLKGF